MPPHDHNRVYKEEVLGRRCSMIFDVEEEDGTTTTGTPYWGTIVEYTHNIELLPESNVRKHTHTHTIQYDDGDREAHDLVHEAKEKRLAWPKEAEEVSLEEDSLEEDSLEKAEKENEEMVEQAVTPDRVVSVKREAGTTTVKREEAPPRPDGMVSSAPIVSPGPEVARRPETPDEDDSTNSCTAVLPVAVPAAVTTTTTTARRRLDMTTTTTTKTTKKRRTKEDPFDYPDWVDDMDQWLQQTPHGPKNKVVSLQNARLVLRQVKKWVRGEGIGYTQWPQQVRFDISNFSLEGSDFEALGIQAKTYEDRYGRDKGNGWLLRHPLRKLQLYQDYCRRQGKF